MSLFDKGNPSPPITELTSEIAQAIYDLFATGLDDTQIHKRGYHPQHIAAVWGECVSLERTAIQAMKWMAEVPKTVDALKAELHSDLLNVDKVVNDVQVYYPNYDPSRTWQQFFEVFVPPKPEPIEEGLGEEGI